MRKTPLSIWSVSWAIASFFFLCPVVSTLAASKEVKESTSQTKETSAKPDKDLTKRLTNKLDMKTGFTILYPREWSPSTQQFQNARLLRRIAPDKRLSLSRQAVEASSVFITTEQRTDHQEAVQRLKEIDAEQDEPGTFLEIGGWPALKRRYMAPMERPGTANADLKMTIRVTVAIAADTLLVRVDGVLAEGTDSKLADEIEAIAQSTAFSKRGKAKDVEKNLRNLRKTPRLLAPQMKKVPQPPKAAPSPEVGKSDAGSTSPQKASPGLAQRLPSGGSGSEIEVAVSTNGQHIVVVSNGRNYSTSNDGGQSFPTTAAFPAVPGGGGNGDPSIAFGASGAFYTGFIGFPPFPPGSPPAPAGAGVCSTGITNSTNNGVNFNFVANATQCDDVNGPTCFPDQEHIAADRFNSSASGQDFVYSAWRNFSGGGCNGNGFGAAGPVITSLVCSSDNGQNWSGAVNVGAGGDYPRITAGQDGFVYVVYRAGNNLMINKFSNCDAGLVSQVGFPRTIVAGISRVTCPVPGLDRCNNGNDLTSQTVAVDDTDPNHVYVAYAVNTANNVNENVMLQDSLDGGFTWLPARTVQLNNGVIGRRFMPWVCSTGGSAYVSWYDMRAASGAQNDVADFYGGSVSLDGTGNLEVGPEFRITEVSDQLCASGWPCVPRSPNDSESCSVQPQLAGSCQAAGGGGSGNRCDFSAGGCPAGETCQTGGGCPKYGDYNGNACAAGRFYTAWASATSPPNIVPASNNVDAFFSLVNFNAPQIQVPGDVYLGDYCVDSTNIETLEVCNTGKDDLLIDDITSSSADFAVTTPSSGYPVVISHDFCFPFEVLLTPTTDGPLAGTLTIASNDTVNPSVDVNVTGEGMECVPQIQVPGDVYLGEFCVGRPNVETLEVCNTGKVNLEVDPILSSNPEVAVTTPSSGYPIVISPDFCFPFEVIHTPLTDGPFASTLTIPSNDPATPNTTVDVTGDGMECGPQIQVPGDIYLGDYCVDDVQTERLHVCNTGKENLTVSPITSDHPDVAVTPPSSGYPVIISPDFCFPFEVVHTPTGSGPLVGTLSIPSDDLLTPVVQVTVTGTGNEPDIRVTGSTDFGITSAWQPEERTVAVCNIGQCGLSVLSATVDCADFALLDNPFPATLEDDGCLDLVVQFTPELPGLKTCELTITSDDPDTPIVTRPLIARTPPAISFHTGFTHPYGRLNNVAGIGPTFNLGFQFPLRPRLAWDVRLGYANFDGSGSRADRDVWSVGANLKYTINPTSPVQVFLNGGPDLYHFEPGDVQFGFNVGLGVRVPINKLFAVEATYNYHNAFTASPLLHFDLFQVGFLTSF